MSWNENCSAEDDIVNMAHSAFTIPVQSGVNFVTLDRISE